jgi:hypothetical protein
VKKKQEKSPSEMETKRKIKNRKKYFRLPVENGKLDMHLFFLPLKISPK